MTRQPAALLTAAAAKLRAAVSAPYVQPGPWVVHQANGFLRVDDDRDTTREAWTVKSGADLAEENRGTAEYIALMHPGVGLALADWLEREAEIWTACETAKAEVAPKGYKLSWGINTHAEALAVARTVLGQDGGQQ
ncbi:hypothetical protein ACWDRR_43425 [Kitasatospora sp. NPDC003701]